jgi:hypothetical protein
MMMKTTRTLITGLLLAAAAVPAFASDEGLPPALERQMASERAAVQAQRAQVR